VPKGYEQDKALNMWVENQRARHSQNKMPPGQKKLLDEIGFAWKDDGRHHNSNKRWHQQYEKMIEFKRTKGHCIVPQRYEQDKSLGRWVKYQRERHAKNIILPAGKELLDELDFFLKADILASRSPTTYVRGLDRHWRIISPFGEAISLTLVLFVLPFCRIWIRKRSPAMWDSQTRLSKKRNKDEERQSTNRKRPSTCLAESEQLGASSRTNQRDKANTGRCSSVEEDGGGRDEADSSRALIGSYPDQGVVHEEATIPGEIPSGWTLVKLEPDC
jgi:hypothetical protein